MSKAKELVRLLYLSADYVDLTEGRDHITGLDHALRVATLAKRHDSESEMVFVGLVHDLARPLSDEFHGEVIAEIVRDLVSDISYNVLRTHGAYQSFYLNNTPIDVEVPWYKQGITLAAWEFASHVEPWVFSNVTLLWDEAVEIINAKCKD